MRTFGIVANLIFSIGVLSAQEKSKDITILGEYKVMYPTEVNSLEVSIINWADKSPIAINRDGKYILQSQENQNRRITFDAQNGKITSDIIILGFRPEDSIVVKQDNFKFISAHGFRGKNLSVKHEILKDSVLSYVNYFTTARYEGKSRLFGYKIQGQKRYGYTNIEHREYDANNLLRESNYEKDGVYYHETYVSGKLATKKFIKDKQHVILAYENEKVKNKLIYVSDSVGYFIETYDPKGKLLTRKEIDYRAFEKEFPAPSMSID